MRALQVYGRVNSSRHCERTHCRDPVWHVARPALVLPCPAGARLVTSIGCANCWIIQPKTRTFGMEAGMGYENLLRVALGGEAVPYVVPDAKFLVSQDGLTFPVLFCAEREKRPFRAYEAQTRANCSLCAAARARRTSSAVVAGMEWLAASWPIKAYHGICYPAEHRAAILAEDICQMGTFVDAAGDAVAC